MEKPSFEELSEYFHGDQRVVTLPGIKTELELPRRIWFRYDGEVDSLIKHLAETQCVLKGKIPPKQSWLDHIIDSYKDYFAKQDEALNLRLVKPDVKDLAAYHRHYPVGSGTYAHVIATKSGLKKSKRIFAEGHEAVEFLMAARLRSLLQRELDIQGIKLDSKSFEGEDFADIGGMLALRRAIDEEETEIVVPAFRTRNSVLKVISDAFGL
jgi:hypothetical protein